MKTPEGRARKIQTLVDVLARGDFDLKKLTADSFVLERLRLDLAKARSEFAAFVPALENFSSGVVTATAAGKYDGKTFVFTAQNPLKVVAQNLSLQLPKSDDRPQPVDVLKNRTLELTMAGALALVEGYMAEPRVHQIATVNPEFVMAAQHDAAFRHTLQTADLCLPDGVGLLYAARRWDRC